MEGEAGPSIRTYVGWAVQIAAGLALLAATALFLFHVYQWIRTGLWPAYAGTRLIADLGLPYPTVSWVGLQHMIDWTMAWSAAGLLVCCGVVVGWIGLCLTYPYEQLVTDAAKKRDELWQPAGLPVHEISPATEGNDNPAGAEAAPGAGASNRPSWANMGRAAPGASIGARIVSGLQSLGCILAGLAICVGLAIALYRFSGAE